MTKHKSEIAERVIKLTRDELMSEHVDELVQRQMSLLGERVIIERKRRWYYRNWFVFMVVGCIAAIIAWAIIEPYFDDLFYIQGKLVKIDTDSSKAPFKNCIGYICVSCISKNRDCLNCIWVHKKTSTVVNGQKGKQFFPEKLKINQEVGVYVWNDFINFKDSNWIAYYVSLTVNPNPPKNALMSLSSLRSRQIKAIFLLFSLAAGFIGLAIGAVDGFICRAFRRALIGGGVGLFIGLIGGFFSIIFAGLVFTLLISLALNANIFSTLGFLFLVIARALAWGIAGITMGLGYGISLRSKRLILYGFIGGIVGGILGGMFFDPLGKLIGNIFSGHWSRLIGLAIIGASVGVAIGVVELVSREAWLRMTEGPLAGKEFMIFKNIMKMGSSPRNEIYLFNDPQVKDIHARLLMVGDEYDIESQDTMKPVLVNNRPVKLVRLHNGDRITMGKTSFIFEKREK